MDELINIKRRHKNRMYTEIDNTKQNNNWLSKTFSKILLSIILILSCAIFIHIDSKNKDWFYQNVFLNNMTFAKINDWYNKNFGNIFPSANLNYEESVSSENTSLAQIQDYLDGYKISKTKNSPIEALASGIIVYLDEKEGYGKTAIIQGIDGIDIWYGNITDVNVNLYDYVEKGTILGNCLDNYYYNVFYKEGNKVSYEDYLNQNKS